MFESLKDFFIFCYKATEKMEEKSEQIHEERQKRWEEFREKSMKAKQEIKEKMDERKTEINGKLKSEIKDWLGSAGFATKEEIEKIESSVKNLEKKIDKLLQEK